MVLKHYEREATITKAIIEAKTDGTWVDNRLAAPLDVVELVVEVSGAGGTKMVNVLVGCVNCDSVDVVNAVDVVVETRVDVVELITAEVDEEITLDPNEVVPDVGGVDPDVRAWKPTAAGE